MHPLIIGGLISWTVNLGIGLFVYFNNPKREVNRKFAFFNVCIGSWSFGSFLLNIIPDKVIAIWILRLSYLFGVFLVPTFLSLVYVLIGEAINNKIKLVSRLFSVFLIFMLPSHLFIKAIYILPKDGLLISSPGPIYYIFACGFGIAAYFGFSKLISAIKLSSGGKRNQLKYISVAYFVATIAGLDYFLSVFRIFEGFPIDDYILVFSVSILAYAIVRHRLLDIRVALTRAGVFAVVYTLVLGIPLGLATWGKEWLLRLGGNWHLFLLIFGMSLASVGPFIYLFLQRRAESILLKEQRRYQQALRELSKTLTRIRDLDKLLKAIVLTVIEQVKVHFAAVYLKDEEYKSYRLKHYFPLKSKSRFQEFIPLDDSLIKVLYEQKRPLPSEEIGPQDKISLDSGLVVPCFIAEGNLLGFLCLGHKPNNQMYTPDDLIVFETLSYSTSLAIENSQFWREIEEHQRQARIQEMDLFSYSLAHEIDNPMNNIKTVAGYLKDYLLKELNLSLEKQKEIESGLNSILGSQERVSGMVKAIEEFGKPTTGEFSPLKLEDVLKNYLDLYLPEFKYHGIYFTKEIPEKIPYIRGVKQELMQILANFSNNSIHALLATKEKKIHLKIEVPNSDFIRIIFKDNGYGITEEKLRSIFAPFVTTKASTEGKGMGLYTIRRIIERHKGRVWAESEGKGKGATFYIELPIAKDVTEEDFKKEDKGKRLF